MTGPRWNAGNQPLMLDEWGGGPVKDFFQFAHERQRVYVVRTDLGYDAPWTDDPVLRARFFTNVFREQDPGTAVAVEIMERDRPGWERLANLQLYRRFNREDTWREAVGYQDLESSPRERLLNVYARLTDRRAAKKSVFTDAHQVYPLPKMAGPDLIAKQCKAVLEFVGTGRAMELWDGCRAADSDVRVAYKLHRDLSGPGIKDFLGWQLTLDASYGGDPAVRDASGWAPVTTGARVGLVLHLNWPRLGLVSGSVSQNGPVEREDRWAGEGWPKLASVKPRELETKLLDLVRDQEYAFAFRGLDFNALGKRLTEAAVEHAMCEWQKYVGIATGLPHSRRLFHKGG